MVESMKLETPGYYYLYKQVNINGKCFIVGVQIMFIWVAVFVKHSILYSQTFIKWPEQKPIPPFKTLYTQKFKKLRVLMSQMKW